MSRRSNSFRYLAWLALAAALLSATTPTLNRLLATSLPGTASLLVQMCTAAGMQWVELSPLPAADAAPGTTAAAEAPAPWLTALSVMDAACGYCVLAAALPLLLLVLALTWAAAPAAGPLPAPPTPTLRPPRNRRGLGSQAPPLLI